MSGLFGSFNTAVTGLSANQAGLQTTSHNINNINTKGFHRQRVELKAERAYNMPGVGQLGMGVKVDGVVRLVDDFVNLQLRNENSTLSQYVGKNDVMGQIESIFNEPSVTGLNFAMGEMFNAWQELSKNPESLNMKSIVVQKAKTFTDTLNHMVSKITDLKADTQANIEKSKQDFNSLVVQLNTINEQIASVTLKGQSPNDLMDQRDLLLERMSELVKIESEYDSLGKAVVKIGDKVVTGPNPEAIDFDAITTGKIGGYHSSIKEMDDRLSELEDFAKGTALMFNQIHNEDGNLTDDFFKFEVVGDKFTISVNELIENDPNLVKAKKEVTSPEGDGSRALAIANLRYTKIDFSTGTLPNYISAEMKFENVATGHTMEGKYGDVVTKVGISVQQSSNMMKNQGAVMGQLFNRRESISGVSLDEEVTNLIKYQRSYEANSRVINTINEMLDTLINRTGI